MKRIIASVVILTLVAMVATAQDAPKTFAQKIESGTRVEVLQGNSITGDPTVQTGAAYLWNSDFNDVGWAATLYTSILDLSEVANIPLSIGAGTVMPESWDRVVPAGFVNYKLNLYQWESLTDAITRIIPILDSDDLTFDIGVVSAYDKLSDQGEEDWLFGISTSLSVSF